MGGEWEEFEVGGEWEEFEVRNGRLFYNSLRWWPFYSVYMYTHNTCNRDIALGKGSHTIRSCVCV